MKKAMGSTSASSPRGAAKLCHSPLPMPVATSSPVRRQRPHPLRQSRSGVRRNGRTMATAATRNARLVRASSGSTQRPAERARSSAAEIGRGRIEALLTGQPDNKDDARLNCFVACLDPTRALAPSTSSFRLRPKAGVARFPLICIVFATSNWKGRPVAAGFVDRGTITGSPPSKSVESRELRVHWLRRKTG